MSTLFERLGDALAPDYQLERELGGGGMGLVFLARDVTLDRRVAIKIIRPELATARATERFLREARILAQLKHPGIVPVHRAGEVGGFAYYVMDYCEGETLQERLEHGPLDLGEVIELGRQLLDGLEVVHRAGLVHRDIKPANVFLQEGRAVLGDFGLAVPETVRTSTPTEPAGFVGTPGYTPPEQSAGGTVTARTDLYAVGVVLYEAITCQRWYAPAPEEGPDWSRVPRGLQPALRRALAWSPERRWRDAAAFRRGLWSARTRRYTRRTIALAAGGLVVGAGVVWLVLGWPKSESHATRTVRIAPVTVLGAVEQAAGDSLAPLIAMDLAGSPDFRVVDGTVSSGAADVELRGSLRAAGGSRCVAASLRASSGGRVTPLRTVCAPGGLVDLADSLASLTLLELWTGQQPLIADLPRRALPRTPWGIAAWARAEQLFFEGRWGEAHEAYTQAERADSTCWLCSWRLSITEDWMSFKHDTARTERYLSHADSFPPQYRSLIQAKVLPLGPRLDSLQAAVTRYPRFFFAWFVLGDELFHRGPLAGHSVAEAVQALERATELGAGFAPAWEHLAWAATEAGDSARAHHALDRWLKAMGGEPRDAFSMGLVAMVEAGYAWRFLGSAVAEGLVNKYLRRPEISASPYLIEAPRYMLTFDAPRGAVWLGAQFAGKGRPADLERSGLLARAFGYVALGRPDSAQAALRALVERFPEPELALFADEYSAALAMADSAAVPGWGKRALAELRRAVAPEAGEPLERGRARWMAALVAGDAGQFQGAVPLRDVLDAWLLARAGRWQAAIARTEGLRLSAESEPPDPVLRALLHLGRGEWFARAGGDPVAMRRELRWAGHENVVGTLDVGPQAADVDWSFRTLARWRLATAPDRAGEQDAEVCHAYRRVAELWAAGEPIYRARADSARRRLGELAACQGIS